MRGPEEFCMQTHLRVPSTSHHFPNENVGTLQTSANSAIRAVIDAPHVGPMPMTDIRKCLNVESVMQIHDWCLALHAWSLSSRWDFSGRDTRGRRAGKIPLPDLRGWSGGITENQAKVMWNKLPEAIKLVNQKEVAKHAIKSWANAL